MINNALVARHISDLLLDIGSRLNDSVAEVKTECSVEEFESYRRTVAVIMGEIFLGLLNPLYAQHPPLKPPEF
jgi:hypothetical protein